MKKVIRRFKKIMGFDKKSEPILQEGEEEVVKPEIRPTKVKKAKKVVEEVEETEIEKLERELEELKEQEVVQEESLEEVTEVEEELENRKAPKLDEILINHEQRITQMEAKWFRLGGI